MRPIIFSLLLIFVFADQAFAWDCYDPKPGHPTLDERKAFITEVSPFAVEAERRYGVPAGALVAMSVVESGYGWTRTSLEANNLFGWKYFSAAAARNKPKYVLTCQPPEDVNNNYIVFSDRADAFDFVASKLASLPYYAGDLASYRTARARGGNVEAAVIAWVAGISDPYNWRPQDYVESVRLVMNNAISPSAQRSEENNLYRLSESVSSTTPEPAVPPPGGTSTAATPVADGDFDYVKERYQRWIDRGGRYMEDDCEAADTTHARYAGFPVRKCTYADISVRATVWLLDADADRLARWSVTACQDAQSANMRACLKALSTHIWGQSQAQFAVDGYVVEPASSGGGTGEAAVCYRFRDGVTISTAAPVDGKCPDAADNVVVVTTGRYARIASTTREQYRAAGGTDDVGDSSPKSQRKPAWLDAVRMLYTEALSSDRNQLISAWAKDAKAVGALE